MTYLDVEALVRELRYELTQAKHRQRWTRAPGGFVQVRPAIVSTEIPPADGTGAATTTGKVRFLTHDNAGNASVAGDETDCWNIFQARIPIDVTCEIGLFGGRWYLITADCEPDLPPLASPIEEQTDGDTMQSGAGTVLII